MKNVKLYAPLLFVALSLLSACQPAGSASTEAPVQVASPTQTVVRLDPTVTDLPATVEPTVEPAGEPTAEPTSEPVIQPTAPPVDIDGDFRPTGPGRVKLAAGRPQLVEFFAYW